MAEDERQLVQEGDLTRFLPISEADTVTFIDSMKNENTTRKTKSDLKLFVDWLRKENELRNVENIEKEKLDQYLARFFLSVRNRKREEHEPDTIKSFQASISRYLMEKCSTNIMTDREFQHSRDVLMAKRKDLKGKWLGNRKRKADPFTVEEIDILHDKHLLGTCKYTILIHLKKKLFGLYLCMYNDVNVCTCRYYTMTHTNQDRNVTQSYEN